MKLFEARQLIKNTFEKPFDRARFTWFISNLLKDSYEEKTFLQTGAQLPQMFSELIGKMEQIGNYVDEDGNIIDILVVELKRGHSVEWARTTQRNFIRRYLSGSARNKLKDAALVAFYSEDSVDWRFSLIKMQYSPEKGADELTPAKRFSFLAGENERSYTAQNQLAELFILPSAPTLGKIESSFNIETVTKEFFEKYNELFLSLNEHIEKEIKKTKSLREELESRNIDSVSFTKKLLGQIVFLYFLQKKGWLGVHKNENWGKGDKHFLRTMLTSTVAEKKNFFSDYLVYLFYEALATEHRGGTDPSYYPRLNSRIPFLNGGLFEADYDWKKNNINIPNSLFTNSRETDEGDTGTGVLDIFDLYNFTVKEDEPLEKQVAVDPEMLGKVFENLLEVKDRKSKGAFYTPREIVHYMCQESLIAYLDKSINGEATSYQEPVKGQSDLFANKPGKGQKSTKAKQGTDAKIDKKDIETYIREGLSAIEPDVPGKAGKRDTKEFALPENISRHAKELDSALANIRICDPAIGSGVFPVGMMNEIVKAREILSAYLPAAKDRTPYEFKRHAIQECIYGVDIDHSAIDIAKLRLWLSLIVDEEDFHSIKPLPNLDYKIVCGNSLFGYPFEPGGFDVIIGNPPWGSKLTAAEKLVLKDKFRDIDSSTPNSFAYFLGVAIKIAKGSVAFVLPDSILIKDYSKTRKLLTPTLRVVRWFQNIGIPDEIKPFVNVEHDVCLVILDSSTTNEIYCSKNYYESKNRSFREAGWTAKKDEMIFEEFDFSFNLMLSKKDLSILDKINQFTPINTYLQCHEGIHTGNSREILFKEKKVNKHCQPLFYGGGAGDKIQNYVSAMKGWYVDYRPELIKKEDGFYASLRDERIFKQPKIYISRTGNPFKAFLDKENYASNNFFSLQYSNYAENNFESLKSILPFIVSTLAQYFIRTFAAPRLGDTFVETKIFHLLKFRIPKLKEAQRNKIVSLVDKILTAKNKSIDADTSKIEYQLDIMVYHLFKLSYEEAVIIDDELSKEDFEKYQLS